MKIALFPLLFCVAGALIWCSSSNSKFSDMGRLMFAVGLFWLVYGLSGKIDLRW